MAKDEEDVSAAMKAISKFESLLLERPNCAEGHALLGQVRDNNYSNVNSD